MPARESRTALYVVAGVLLAKRLLTAHYGLNREAGGEFQAVLHILEGRLIYRDFFWYHGFLPLYIDAFLFKIFSPQVYWIRLAETVYAVAGGVLACKVALRVLPPTAAVVSALLAFSGLLIPLHVSGQLLALTLEIAALHFLIRHVESNLSPPLVASGFFTGLTFLVQMFPVGVVTLFGSILAIIFYAVFDTRSRIAGLKPFLLGFFPLPVLAYGLLSVFVPQTELIRSLFPMYTGYEVSPEKFSGFLFPPPWPDFSAGWAPAQVVTALNRYTVVNFRWWLIVVVFFWGLIEFFMDLKKPGTEPRQRLILGTLVLFAPLFEIKFLIYHGRVGQASALLNLLPTYTLLLYLTTRRIAALSTFVGGILLCVYFIYPLGKYGWFFHNNAQPLGLPYTDHIKVSPYKKDLYDNVHRFLLEHSDPGERVVMAEINRYHTIFAGRRDLFEDNFLTFFRASFYPSQGLASDRVSVFPVEREIVEKIEQAGIRIILFPEDFRKFAPDGHSPLLDFLEEKWQRVALFGDASLVNPFENESRLGIYMPRTHPASQ
jgi:hypothetical protein